MSSSENLSPAVLIKLMREIKSLSNSPPEGITLVLNEDNISIIGAVLSGPQGTPFEGGRFRISLSLPSDYPASPPKGYFLTKLFHPNVSATGEICVNTLKKDWSPELGIRHVLLVIHCLLIHPNPESALNEEAGKLLMEDYGEYEKRVRLMTKIHAVPKKGAAADAADSKIDASVLSSSSPRNNASNLPAQESNAPDGSLVKPAASVDKRATEAPKTSAPKVVKKSIKRL